MENEGPLAVKLPEWRTWRTVAYLLLIAVAVTLIVIYWHELAAIWRDQALTFVGVMVVMTLGTFVQAHNFLEFLDTPIAVRVLRFTPVWAWGALANYVAPLQAGGIAVRVAWLTRHKISVSSSLLATWRQLIVSLWVSLAGLATGVLLTGDPRGRWPAWLLLAAWLGAAVLRKLLLAALSGLHRPQWIVRRKDLLQSAAVGITLRGVVGVVAQYVLGTVVVYLVYSRFGAQINVGQAVVLACIVYVATIVAVLPANLGVLEVIYMLVGHGFGMSVEQVGALAVLLRAAHIVSNGLLVMWGAVVFHGPRKNAGGVP
jgi:hypothetical protein